MLALSLLSTSGRLGCQSYLQQQISTSHSLHDRLTQAPQHIVMALTGQKVWCSPLPTPAASNVSQISALQMKVLCWRHVFLGSNRYSQSC